MKMKLMMLMLGMVVLGFIGFVTQTQISAQTQTQVVSFAVTECEGCYNEWADQIKDAEDAFVECMDNAQIQYDEAAASAQAGLIGCIDVVHGQNQAWVDACEAEYATKIAALQAERATVESGCMNDYVCAVNAADDAYAECKRIHNCP